MYEQSKENHLIENFAIAKIPLPSRCPKDYPYVAYDGKICYTDKKYAEKKSGPCESWCTNDPTFGSGCGDPSLKLCKSKVFVKPVEPPKIIVNPRKTMIDDDILEDEFDDDFDDDEFNDEEEGLSITIIVLILVVILLLLLLLAYYLGYIF
jgi:hypothetical protein